MKKTTEYFAIAADPRIVWPTISESGPIVGALQFGKAVTLAVTLDTPLSTKVASATP